MASSCGLPLNGSATHLHNHQGHSHTRSHHRKPAPERIPILPTSIEGSNQMSVKSPQKKNDLRGGPAHMYSRSLPLNSWKESGHPTQTANQFPQVETYESTGNGFASQGQRLRRSDSQNRAQARGYGFPETQLQSNGALVTGPDGEARYNTYQVSFHVSSADMAIRSSSAGTELMSAILIPLPYVLTSLILAIRSPKPALDSTIARLIKPDSEVLHKLTAQGSLRTSNMFITCALTSVTLLGVGIMGKLRGTTTPLDRRKRGMSTLERGNARKQKSSATFTIENARRIGGRMLAIGLPFYAATHVGGERVATIVLLGAIGHLTPDQGHNLDLTNVEGWKRVLKQRIWTLTVLAVQFTSDFAGITINVGRWITMLGYIALGTSALVIPPPYTMCQPKATNITEPMPNSARKTSTVATPWEAPPVHSTPLTPVDKQSPLIATSKDTNLTLCAGILTACVPFIMAFLPLQGRAHISYESLAWILLASIAASLSLLFADPERLQGKRKIGLAFGLILPVVVQELLELRPLWVFALEGVFVGCFWIAIHHDTHSASLHSPHLHSHHKDNVLHELHSVSSHNHGPHSRFTGALLAATSSWPLLHSILVEKDSRRILYFMWYVMPDFFFEMSAAESCLV